MVALVSHASISSKQSGTVLWGLGDHEGTMRDIVRNDRTVVDHRQFDAFGNMTSESAPATDFVFGYTGQTLDKATGLYDYGHRWYDPSVGRFASEDPSAFSAGDMNLYRYVNNDPLNNTDPTGLCKIKTTADAYLSARPYQEILNLPGADSIGNGWYVDSPIASAGLSGVQLGQMYQDIQGAAFRNEVNFAIDSQRRANVPTVSSIASPQYVKSAPLGNTGASINYDVSGQAWHNGEQVASIKQVGTGKGLLDDFVADISWCRAIAPQVIARIGVA